MDALGMQDEKDVPYRSARDGVCHACGHDVHTAILLGLASYLSEHRDQIPGGCVKLIFQPPRKVLHLAGQSSSWIQGCWTAWMPYSEPTASLNIRQV